MQQNQEKSQLEQSRTTTPFEAPGRNGSPVEQMIGRTVTPQDFNSTMYSWEGLEEICLENIVIAQLNQDVLKKNFEIIINALKKQNFQIGRLGKQLTLNDDFMNEMRERLEKQEGVTRELTEKNLFLEVEVEDLKKGEGNLKDEIEKLKKRDEEQQIEIDDLMQRLNQVEERMQRLEGLEGRVGKLEDQSRMQEDRINDLQERLNNLEGKLSDLTGKINEVLSKYETFEDKIKLMQSLNSNESESGDLSEIADLKNKIKNCATRDDLSGIKEDTDFLLKEFKRLQERLESLTREFYLLKNEELPGRFLEIKSEIQKIYDLLRNRKRSQESVNLNRGSSNANNEASTFERPLVAELNEKLNGKVGFEDLEALRNEIAGLLERIRDLENQKPGSMSDSKEKISGMGLGGKDSSGLKELMGKYNDLEGLIRKLQKDLNDTILKMKILEEKKMDKFDLEELLRRISGLDNELKPLKEKQLSNEKLLTSHDMAINDILKELARMRKRKSSNSNTGTVVNPEQLNALVDDVLSKLKAELVKMIEEVNKKVDKKIEMEDLWKSEASILEKIDEIINILVKKFCDRNETKKALIHMENRINQLFAVVFGDGSEKDQEALFAKKPLFWSCASCDKDLDKFQGKLGDYKNWGQFPPKNTSPERMGRFGTGYARMLEDRRTHLAKEREKVKSQMASSQKGTNYENFPDINNFKEPPKSKAAKPGNK